MESTKNRKKGLLSIVALIVCLAMLTVGTFAWFTDTATVKGNKVYAGNLYVDVVAKGAKIAAALDPEYKEDDSVENHKFENVKAENSAAFDKPVKSGSETENDYFIVTDKTVPLIKLENVEPGSTWPVDIDVKNSGDLAISYSAGFSIDTGMSKTGLETLEEQYSDKTDPEYSFRKAKLGAKQKNSAGADIGKKLEEVLEVYAVTKAEYEKSNKENAAEGKSMDLLKEDVVDPATGEVTKKANYIGTVDQIIKCNDAAYMAGLTDATKKAELLAVAARLAANASGYCVPTDVAKDPDWSGSVPVYNTAGGLVETKTGVSDIGTAYYAIHMPTTVDDLYQNASITLNVGVTATQVEFETDGTNVMIYDNTDARQPAAEPDPTPAP